MKKLLALLLALLMVFTLAACGGNNDDDDEKDVDVSISSDKDNDEKDNTNSAIPTLPPSMGDDAQIDVNDVTGNNPAVEEYINKNKAYLISAMESALSSSGMNCKTDISVIGNGFVITIKLIGVDGIDASMKEQMQANVDNMQSYYDNLLTGMKTELPELEYFVYEVCEEDGDLLAEVVIGER